MESGCPDLTNESSLQKTERGTIIRLTRNHLVFLPSVLTERSHFLSFNINSKEADFFIADQMLLLTIAGVAVIMDLYKMRVKNSWILCSLLAGAGTCLWQKGFAGLIKFVPGMLMPLVVLGWLFYFRMLVLAISRYSVHWEGSWDLQRSCGVSGFPFSAEPGSRLLYCSAVEESGRGWRTWQHILWSIFGQAAPNPIIEGKVHWKIFILLCPYL